MLQRFWVLIAVLALSTSVSSVRADLLVFGSDTKKSTELSDLVTKNASAQSAIVAFQRGDIQECERLLREATKDAKDLPAIDVMIARLLMAKGQFNEALTRLEQYLMRTPKDAEAHATMGEIAFMSGRLTDAWLQFREALTLVMDPASTLSKPRKDAFVVQLLRMRAETSERRQDLETADKLFKELEKATPEAGYPIMAQGRILISKGEISKGADMLRKARKLDSSILQPELQIAMVLSSGKDHEETEKWFRDGIKQTDSVTVSNWSEYLKWLLAQDRPEDVRLLVARAPAKFQSHRLLKFLDAMALRYLGKLDEAEKAFSALHSENTDDLEAADQLALILVESIDQGKKVRAQQLSQTNLRRAPNEENAIATAAWVEYRLGAIDVANQYLSALVQRGTSNPQTIYYVARLFESRRQEGEANALYQTAANLPGLFVQRKEVKEMLAKKEKEREAAKAAEEKSKDSKSKDEKAKDDKAAKSEKSTGGADSAKPDAKPDAKSTPQPLGDSTKAAAKQPPVNPTKTPAPGSKK